jgi:hypothetical protein
MMRALAAALLLALLPGVALSQTGAPSACGPVSVSNSAVAVTFPASGTHGPNVPQRYLTIVNPHASNTCWLNVQPGGTAAANTAGSIPLNPLGGYWTWSAAGGYPPPSTVSIICPSGATPVTCNYQ